jgi:transcriptional antiterminator RfaH
MAVGMPDRTGGVGAGLDLKWYVIRAKPRRERFVEVQLTQQGIDAYFPTYPVKPVNPRAARERAYFPGYLFVHTDLEKLGANRLRWLPAAVALLEFGDVPAVVPNAFIAQLRKRLVQVWQAGGLELAGLSQGDRVTITSGPFAGYDAVFDLSLKGTERVRVLIEMLRRQVAVELDAGSIRKKKPRGSRAG